MILDRPRQFVFVHVPKTGGTAIKRALHKSFSDGHFVLLGPSKHWTAAHICNSFAVPWGPGTDWTIAAVVRNPWDMLASDYEFCKSYVPKIKTLNREDLGSWYKKVLRTAEYRNADEFVTGEHLGNGDAWFQYCTDRNGNDIVNYVLRFEQLQEDFDDLCMRLCYPPQKLPIVNKTKKRHHYRELFSRTMAGSIGELYRDYAERFGYAY